MCQLEDVYHTPCSHWAEKPSVRHSCINAREHSDPQTPNHNPFTSPYSSWSASSTDTSSISSKSANHAVSPCHNSQKTRSRTEHTFKCSKCTTNVDAIVSKQSGMWFSCYLDSVTGKPKYKNRAGESEASRAARSGTPRKLTKNPPKQSRPARKMTQEEWEEEKSRSNSWSSHGHVEL